MSSSWHAAQGQSQGTDGGVPMAYCPRHAAVPGYWRHISAVLRLVLAGPGVSGPAVVGRFSQAGREATGSDGPDCPFPPSGV